MSGEHVVDLLPELELGTLDPAAKAPIEAHLAACPACRKEHAALRETLAGLSFELPASAPPRGLRDLVVAAVGPTPSFEGFVGRFARIYDVSAAKAREILSAIHDVSTWEPYVPGVTLFHFAGGPATGGADAGLVRFDAGMRYPRHRHVGNETMFLLSGSFRDDVTGAWARPGDVLVMGPGTSHSFTIGPDEPCISGVLLEGGLPILEG